MRAIIIVKHDQSAPTSHPAGPDATGFLKTLPGASEIRVERENFSRVTISHRWKDPAPAPALRIGSSFVSRGTRP